MRATINENIILRNQKGFALISIIAVLVILCILAAIEIPKYLSPNKDKDKIQDSAKITGGMTVPKNDNLPDDARNIAGMTALVAAASNVQMAHAKLVISNTSGTTVSSEAVVNLLNSSYSSVGDYVVSYSTSGPDKVTATLQASSKGKFGIPNSKEIALIR